MMQWRDLTPRCIIQQRDLTPRFEIKFEKKLGHESGSKVGTFDEKKRRW
jgi:hypothetical protein